MAICFLLKLLLTLCGLPLVVNYDIRDGFSRKNFSKFISTIDERRSRYQVADNYRNAEEGNPCGSKQNRICVEVLNQNCIATDDIFDLLVDNDVISNETIEKTLPWILSNHAICSNKSITSKESEHGHRPGMGQVWGYGIGFVALVIVISNIGAFLMPCIDKKYFQRLLMFLVGMAAGTLAATGILVLIPEAFNLMEIEELAHDYVWKCSAIFGGVYFFFLAERIMQVGFGRQSRRKQEVYDQEVKEMIKMKNGTKEITESNVNDDVIDNIRMPGVPKGKLTPVAWILLTGDALHNFVDGLSIGAAFTENVYLGISVSIAVLCEELPHELGDIAILLHTGLSMKRALLYNFIAAVFCVVGLVLGIVLGETTAANKWIFAIAGGMFIYIAVGDLFPEMNLVAKNEPGKNGPIIATILHNIGIIIGFVIIVLVANFSGNIRIMDE